MVIDCSVSDYCQYRCTCQYAVANQRVKATVVTIESALKEAIESVIRRQDVTLTYNSALTPKTLLTADGAELSN